MNSQFRAQHRLPATHADRVDLWWVDTARLPDPVEGHLALLNAVERARAERFALPALRQRYILAHGALRRILSAYLGQPPQDLQFTRGPWGKPELSGYPLRFNLSYAENLMLLAITQHRALGVDLERIRPVPEMEDIAALWFSALERDVWQRLPAEQKLHAFFHAWTRKEAFLKASGRGLSQPLTSFSVALEPDHPAALLHSPPELGDAWTLLDLPAADGLAAALVIEGGAPELAHFHGLPNP